MRDTACPPAGIGWPAHDASRREPGPAPDVPVKPSSERIDDRLLRSSRRAAWLRVMLLPGTIALVALYILLLGTAVEQQQRIDRVTVTR